jgi:hypothetical protein
MKRSLNEIGCEFGRRYEMQFMNFKEDVTKEFSSIKTSLSEIKDQNKELFNHQSSRWPRGAVWALGVLTAVASAVITGGLMKLFG